MTKYCYSSSIIWWWI